VLGLLLVVAGCKRSQASESMPQGSALFAGACARCHGLDGSGGLPVSPGGPSPRNFRDHAFQAAHTDEQIKTTIVQGKGTAMPAFGDLFDDAQLRALVAHVRSLDEETRPQAQRRGSE
jgi:cytochrome c oxidase cbb3-type subunit III